MGILSKLRSLFKREIVKELTLEERIVALRSEGYSQKYIAEKVSLTQNQVKGILYKLLKEGKIERKKKYKKRTSKEEIIKQKAKEIYEEQKGKPKNTERKYKYVDDYSISPGTIKMDQIDWLTKYDIDLDKFKNYYLTHNCIETGLYFNIPWRNTSKIAKQLGISKRKPYTKRKRVRVYE